MNDMMTLYKWFWAWEFEKEERWLNEMAMDGWALASVGFCRYTFETCEPGEYTVRLEMHHPDLTYLSFMEETGAEYIGRVVKWIYFRKKTELGQFNIFSDLDSRIKHLDRIGTVLKVAGILNLGIGVKNSINAPHIGWINLLLASVLLYGLGRIHGKIELLELDRQLHD